VIHRATTFVRAALAAFASPQESATLLEQVRRAIVDLAGAPNYVCMTVNPARR
jgi:hypothetical protein